MKRHQFRHTFTLIGVILFALLLALGGAMPAAAAQAKSTTPHTWTIPVGVDSKDHSITGMDYLTDEIWIDAGDSIVWNANSYEPHTVTFLPPGQEVPKYDPNSPVQNFPQGGNSYDGHSFYNSGLLSLLANTGFGSASYRLTFPVTGTFTYHCFLHDMMTGIVHVRPTGAPYPLSQAQYNVRAADHGRDLLHDGEELLEGAMEHSNSHHITVGATDGNAMVMQFIPAVSKIEVGDTITFTDRTPTDDPHTVSYGNPPTNVFPPPPYGNRKGFTGQPLNSGLLGSETNWVNQTYGNVYRVTFKKVGTYQFFCFIHGGMVVNITVEK